MSNNRLDIDDNEIRVISSNAADKSQAVEKEKARGRRRRKILWIAVAIAIVAAAAIIVTILAGNSGNGDEESLLDETVIETNTEAVAPEPGESPKAVAGNVTEGLNDAPAAGYVTRRDTTVNDMGLVILTPVNATPILAVGDSALSQLPAVLAAQAADIRKDNGNIVGTYVLKGELLSKGEAKAGYCSIVNGDISLGVADTTPMLEQALQTEGYFFRQYPLVAGGQLVENKPKGIAMRKALAEIDGRMSIVLSKQKLTFHDFSQALIDIGTRNAIYLVGGNAQTSYRNDEGNTVLIGEIPTSRHENTNYIVWM